MTPDCQDLLRTALKRIDALESRLGEMRGAYESQREAACTLFDQLNPDNSQPMTFRPPELKTPEPMEIHLRSLVKESASSLADMEMNLHEARLTIASLRNQLNSEQFAAQRLLKERDSTQSALNNALVENDRLKREAEAKEEEVNPGRWQPFISWNKIFYPCEIKKSGEDTAILLKSVPNPVWNSAGITHWRPL